MINTDTKVCCRCKQEKGVSEFYKYWDKFQEDRMSGKVIYICNKCGSRRAYFERGKCEECGGILVTLLKWAERFKEEK